MTGVAGPGGPPLTFPLRGMAALGSRSLARRLSATATGLTAALILTSCGAEPGAPTPYVPGPGDAWEVRAPEDLGMDGAKLQEAVAYALAHETTEIPEDPGAYLLARLEGIPH